MSGKEEDKEDPKEKEDVCKTESSLLSRPVTRSHTIASSEDGAASVPSQPTIVEKLKAAISPKGSRRLQSSDSSQNLIALCACPDKNDHDDGCSNKSKSPKSRKSLSGKTSSRSPLRRGRKATSSAYSSLEETDDSDDKVYRDDDCSSNNEKERGKAMPKSPKSKSPSRRNPFRFPKRSSKRDTEEATRLIDTESQEEDEVSTCDTGLGQKKTSEIVSKNASTDSQITGSGTSSSSKTIPSTLDQDNPVENPEPIQEIEMASSEEGGLMWRVMKGYRSDERDSSSSPKHLGTKPKTRHVASPYPPKSKKSTFRNTKTKVARKRSETPIDDSKQASTSNEQNPTAWIKYTDDNEDKEYESANSPKRSSSRERAHKNVGPRLQNPMKKAIGYVKSKMKGPSSKASEDCSRPVTRSKFQQSGPIIKMCETVDDSEDASSGPDVQKRGLRDLGLGEGYESSDSPQHITRSKTKGFKDGSCRETTAPYPYIPKKSSSQCSNSKTGKRTRRFDLSQSDLKLKDRSSPTPLMDQLKLHDSDDVSSDPDIYRRETLKHQRSFSDRCKGSDSQKDLGVRSKSAERRSEVAYPPGPSTSKSRSEEPTRMSMVSPEGEQRLETRSQNPKDPHCSCKNKYDHKFPCPILQRQRQKKRQRRCPDYKKRKDERKK